MKPGISVVVPYAGSLTFAETLRSLLQQTLNRRYFGIIVVAELGTMNPDLVVMLNATRATVFYCKRPENFNGHTAGILRNVGVSNARRRILLFVDSDAVLAPDCLAEHFRLHRVHPDHVICGGWRELAAHTQYILRRKSFSFEKLYDMSLRDYRAKANKLGHWENAYSGNLSVAKRLFHLVGGFDEHGHRVHDLDLGYRLFRAGAKFRYSPECRAVHIEHPRSIISRLEQARGWKSSGRSSRKSARMPRIVQ